MGNGASTNKDKSNYQVPDYPVQPPNRPPVQPPSYNEQLHVPVSFYPNNVYSASSSSSGGGVFAQLNRDIDNFDRDLTESLDGNRFFNAVRDPSIPPAPGSITAVTFMPSTSQQMPPPSVPQYQPQPHPQQPIPPIPPSYSSVYPSLPEKK